MNYFYYFLWMFYSFMQNLYTEFCSEFCKLIKDFTVAENWDASRIVLESGCDSEWKLKIPTSSPETNTCSEAMLTFHSFMHCLVHVDWMTERLNKSTRSLIGQANHTPVPNQHMKDLQGVFSVHACWMTSYAKPQVRNIFPLSTAFWHYTDRCQY